MSTRIALHSAARDAAETLLKGYRDASLPGLSVYRARPATITPPHAFVDSINEQAVWFAGTMAQRTLRVAIVCVWGTFDSQDAVDQRDRFLEGFYDYVAPRFHEMDANSDLQWVGVEDLPAWVPEWQPPNRQRSYYASQITLEGNAGT